MRIRWKGISIFIFQCRSFCFGVSEQLFHHLLVMSSFVGRVLGSSSIVWFWRISNHVSHARNRGTKIHLDPLKIHRNPGWARSNYPSHLAKKAQNSILERKNRLALEISILKNPDHVFGVRVRDTEIHTNSVNLHRFPDHSESNHVSCLQKPVQNTDLIRKKRLAHS